MGLDLDNFVYPDRISPELICPICTVVLSNPVQTPDEHLFCEEELLTWMLSSDLCPITKNVLDPNMIAKPGRIVTNMLGELDRYCPNRHLGCLWTGKNHSVDGHFKTCQFVPRQQLCSELEEKTEQLEVTQIKLSVAENRILSLEDQNEDLMEQITILERKLNVFECFFNEKKAASDDSVQATAFSNFSAPQAIPKAVVPPVINTSLPVINTTTLPSILLPSGSKPKEEESATDRRDIIGKLSRLRNIRLTAQLHASSSARDSVVSDENFAVEGEQ